MLKEGQTLEKMGMFHEDNGNISMTRIVGAVIVLTILFNWTWYNMCNHVYEPIGGTNIALILGWLTGKVAQKAFGEEKVK